MASCAQNKLPIACVKEDREKRERVQRAQWLRAAILGANDGLLSTTLLMLGVGAAKDDRWSMILSGIAGALAGACSMAVGEFVSISTQRDIEKATKTNKNLPSEQPVVLLQLEISSVDTSPKSAKESTVHGEAVMNILEPKLPHVFSPGRSPMMKAIAEDAKTNNNYNIMRSISPVAVLQKEEDEEERVLPNPYNAAVASALAFLCGSIAPLASSAFVTQNTMRVALIAIVASITLAFFGCFGAYLGGSPVKVSAMRVLVGGWIAMAITYGLLKPFDQTRDTE